MVRTPCWFAVVNLVALDMLKEKIPALRSLSKSFLSGKKISLSIFQYLVTLNYRTATIITFRQRKRSTPRL